MLLEGSGLLLLLGEDVEDGEEEEDTGTERVVFRAEPSKEGRRLELRFEAGRDGCVGCVGCDGCVGREDDDKGAGADALVIDLCVLGSEVEEVDPDTFELRD